MEKNNKLIAEFMGWEYDENNDWYFTPHRVEVTDGIYDNEIPSDLFEFHSSWDWLMPVVQKIGDEYLNTPFDETYSHLTEQYENIWTLEDTYNAVVEFIKEQNN